ncbi:hypothetical protein BX661DRAFT_189530 [Kickxella alabastrina]|uniref:uncharacterized protein n=1 Tax=Kickxella alabastrina TaxID=61397 RepID=UPI00222008A5|nr:uncharacterized protein BX661DRAFT_189530 [Kickxella alabastrina]KAI7820079.1 hypothetical protein BX661DRAFT_189530 [Kickxella alabastrina]
MTQIHDKAVGAALLGIGSLWYAIALPVFLLIVGVTAIFGFLSFIMLKSAKKAAKKAT